MLEKRTLERKIYVILEVFKIVLAYKGSMWSNQWKPCSHTKMQGQQISFSAWDLEIFIHNCFPNSPP